MYKEMVHAISFIIRKQYARRSKYPTEGENVPFIKEIAKAKTTKSVWERIDPLCGDRSR